MVVVVCGTLVGAFVEVVCCVVDEVDAFVLVDVVEACVDVVVVVPWDVVVVLEDDVVRVVDVVVVGTVEVVVDVVVDVVVTGWMQFIAYTFTPSATVRVSLMKRNLTLFVL